MHDTVLPPKSLLKSLVYKKNRTLGYEPRYLLLGHTHLLIARDPEFNNLLNIIPLEGGYVVVKKPRDFGGIVLTSH